MPTLAKEMRSELGLAIARKEALPVALDAQDALTRSEIGEVPNLLAHHTRALVHNLEIRLIVIDLIFLGIHNRRGVVHARYGIDSELDEDNRLAEACPGVELPTHSNHGSFEIGTAKVPAVIAVEADNIGELSGAVVSGRCSLDAR